MNRWHCESTFFKRVYLLHATFFDAVEVLFPRFEIFELLLIFLEREHNHHFLAVNSGASLKLKISTDNYRRLVKVMRCLCFSQSHFVWAFFGKSSIAVESQWSFFDSPNGRPELLSSGTVPWHAHHNLSKACSSTWCLF